MRVFLDANILVSVLNKEYPQYTYAAKVLSLSDRKGFNLYTSALCLAIAFYFSEKKSGAAVAKRKIGLLLEHIHIADCGITEVAAAKKNRKALDFEDALQYYSAMSVACDYIVTQDTSDFHFAEIPVLEAEDFLRQISKA